MDILIKKTIGAFRWHLLFRIVNQSFSWFVTIFMVRILDPEDYGLMGMAMILIGFMNLFNGIGVGPSIIQKQRKDLDEQLLHSLFWIAIFISFALYLVLFLSSSVAASYFREQDLSPIIKVLGLIFILKALSLVPSNLLVKDLELKKRGVAESFAKIVASVLCIVLALSGFKVWSLVFSYLFQEICMCVAVFYFVNYSPRLYFSKKRVFNMLAFGVNVSASKVFWYLYSNADFFIIGRVLGKNILGYYSVAFQLASIPIAKINNMLNSVLFPMYCEMQHDIKEVKFYFLQNIKLVSSFFFPVYIGLTIIAQDFFYLIIGQKWQPAIYIFQVLCITGLIRSIASQHPSVLNAIGKTQVNLKFTFMMLLVMPIAFYIAAKTGGVNWVSLTWLCVYPFLAYYLIHHTLIELKISVKKYFSCLLPPFVCSLLMATVIIGFQQTVDNRILRMITSVLLGGVLYPFFMYFVSKTFFNDILSILKKMR